MTRRLSKYEAERRERLEREKAALRAMTPEQKRLSEEREAEREAERKAAHRAEKLAALADPLGRAREAIEAWKARGEGAIGGFDERRAKYGLTYALEWTDEDFYVGLARRDFAEGWLAALKGMKERDEPVGDLEALRLLVAEIKRNAVRRAAEFGGRSSNPTRNLVEAGQRVAAMDAAGLSDGFQGLRTTGMVLYGLTLEELLAAAELLAAGETLKALAAI